MPFEIREVQGVTIFDLAGQVDLQEASDLQRRVGMLLAAGKDKFILNWSLVTSITDPAIDELCRPRSAFWDLPKKAKIIIQNGQRLYDTIQALFIITIFDVLTDEARAIASFQQ